MSLTIKIRGVREDYWNTAVRLARTFIKEYPGKMGWRDGVIYVPQNIAQGSFYVYRTKTSIVVRGELES